MYFSWIEMLLVFTLVVLIVGGISFLYYRERVTCKTLHAKYKDIIDIDNAVEKRKEEYDDLDARYVKLDDNYREKNDELNSAYQLKKAVYERLLEEISILEEDMEFTTYGIYKPHFDFDTSEQYKNKMEDIRKQQKQLIKDKQSVMCPTEWEVGGSKREGRKMVNRNMKLMLRAFNNECDASVLKVKWNNADKMEQRIKKAFEAINVLGESQHIEITHEYLDLRLNELYLTHEYQEKLYEEKEEQRRIREQMREEEKAQKEIEKAKQDAEDEEGRYQKALERARKETEKAKGVQLDKLNVEIEKLQEQLKEAHEKKERAVSRAQLTKSGHVYVISNIGSFGEDVFKIGMTRRLEPMDRVKELGDASVPFSFDVHAIIYSENAPDLENKLHLAFDKQRVNMVNPRKEFFSASLDDVENLVKENHGNVEFTKLVEAKEYHETLALKEQKGPVEAAKSAAAFPASL